MRHGLMGWREEELAQADVRARQARLQAAMRAQGLDGVVVYTNLVRSAAVTYLSGFTPYWSDCLLLVPAEGRAMMATALSKRVGRWIQSTNPTADIAHSPAPGRLIGERLAASGAGKVGVVELDRLPIGLVEEIRAVRPVELVDATALFGAVRAVPDAAELRLAAKADAIAAAAFAKIPADPKRVGDVTEALELAVRNAGAEECYVAIAPDLRADQRLARIKGGVALGASYAVRLSIAYHGVWIRRTESFGRSGNDRDLPAIRQWADALAQKLQLNGSIESQITAFDRPNGLQLRDWMIEAPVGTWPLAPVDIKPVALPYGVLTLHLAFDQSALVLARAIGLAD